jgi:hypothetical protein
MNLERPTDDLRGTEPARQTNDPALSERDADDPIGPTAAVQDSGPGIVLAIALLGIFLVVLVAAVVSGLAA